MTAQPPTANSAVAQFLKSIPLFAYVEDEDMLEILRLLRPVELEAGQVLFREGAPGDAWWVLGTGCEVAIFSAAPTGGKNSVLVGCARGGETVGEMALIDDGERSGTARVVHGGPAHQVYAADFHALRTVGHPAAYKILRKMCVDLCARLRATSDRIAPAAGHHAPKANALKGVRPRPEVIQEFGPFRSLPKVVQLALSQKLQLIEVPAVTALFGEGEPTDGAYFVLSGEVTIGRQGRTLATVGAGSMIGMVSCIDAGRRSASCITTAPSRLLRLSDPDFDALFASGNRFAFQLVELVARQLVDHLRQANRLLPAAGQRPGAPRPLPTPGVGIPAVTEEEVLPEAEILPLELEMDVDEPLEPLLPG